MKQSRFDKIHHIAIISSNYEASYRFYVDILGFKILHINKRPNKKDIKLDLMLNNTTQIELFIKANAPSRITNPEAYGLRHLALSTDNIEQDIKYLQQYNIKMEELRIDDYTGEKMIFFYDPDGLPIELHE